VRMEQPKAEGAQAVREAEAVVGVGRGNKAAVKVESPAAIIRCGVEGVQP